MMRSFSFRISEYSTIKCRNNSSPITPMVESIKYIEVMTTKINKSWCVSGSNTKGQTLCHTSDQNDPSYQFSVNKTLGPEVRKDWRGAQGCSKQSRTAVRTQVCFPTWLLYDYIVFLIVDLNFFLLFFSCFFQVE